MVLAAAACWLLGVSCPPPALAKPTIEIVRMAYEREAARNAAKHDKDLEIVAAECSTMSADGEYLCWITLTSEADATRAQSTDVATLTNAAGVWTLIGGLCKK